MATALPPDLSAALQVKLQRDRQLILTLLVVVGCLAAAAMVLLLQALSIVAVLTWTVVLAIAWRARLGLYVAFGLLLLFESGSPDALMLPGYYLTSGLASSLGLTGAITSPLEL